MNVSTTIPTTVQIRREHLIGLIVAAVAVAAAITWLLVAVAFDSGSARTQVTPAAKSTGCPHAYQCMAGFQFPPGYRGMP